MRDSLEKRLQRTTETLVRVAKSRFAFFGAYRAHFRPQRNQIIVNGFPVGGLECLCHLREIMFENTFSSRRRIALAVFVAFRTLFADFQTNVVYELKINLWHFDPRLSPRAERLTCQVVALRATFYLQKLLLSDSPPPSLQSEPTHPP